jgi:hypothetical protein
VGFSGIWDRVKQITGWKNQSDMAAFLGIAGSNISEAKARDSFPYAWMEKISVEFQVSMDWLLTGKTYPAFPEMLDSRTAVREPGPVWGGTRVHGGTAVFEINKPAHDDEAAVLFQTDADRFVFIPLIEAQLSTEDGDFVVSEAERIHLAFSQDWLLAKATSPDNLLLLIVRGASMEGTLKDGDTVLVDRGRKSIYAGGIYAVKVGGMIYTKKLELLVGGRVRVISDNRNEFTPYDVDEADLDILGQVIWCGRALV